MRLRVYLPLVSSPFAGDVVVVAAVDVAAHVGDVISIYSAPLSTTYGSENIGGMYQSIRCAQNHFQTMCAFTQNKKLTTFSKAPNHWPLPLCSILYTRFAALY